ncbi:hypothetical protein RJT34_33179 [Clitoria ternatea]|uniref:Uncharacterized protein n=1 Tax=Clitoria ternatea TaxID=43366 RepID=A0AAN9EXD2_CLITE
MSAGSQVPRTPMATLKTFRIWSPDIWLTTSNSLTLWHLLNRVTSCSHDSNAYVNSSLMCTLHYYLVVQVFPARRLQHKFLNP